MRTAYFMGLSPKMNSWGYIAMSSIAWNLKPFDQIWSKLLAVQVEMWRSENLERWKHSAW